jgi:SAM-dependent methyltransferase
METHQMTNHKGTETNPIFIRSAIARRFDKLLECDGSVTFKAIPGLCSHYVDMMSGIWKALGKAPTFEELKYFHDSLLGELSEAFDDSPHSKVVVSYKTNLPPQTNLTFTIEIVQSSIVSEYADWVASREGALFGEWPDQKVMNVAQSMLTSEERVVDNSRLRILDIGAGTGRNTLPLAELGHMVDAVEISPELYEILVSKSNVLPITSYCDDIFRSSFLSNDFDLIFLSEVVTHFRSVNQLQRIFEIANTILKPNGILLFNAFVANAGYNPSNVLLEASEVGWSPIFTLQQVRDATGYKGPGSQMTWEFISQESCLQYEKTHTPPEHWPPTVWFEGWCQGLDVVDLPVSKVPFELRWFVFRKM